MVGFAAWAARLSHRAVLANQPRRRQWRGEGRAPARGLCGLSATVHGRAGRPHAGAMQSVHGRAGLRRHAYQPPPRSAAQGGWRGRGGGSRAAEAARWRYEAPAGLL